MLRSEVVDLKEEKSFWKKVFVVFNGVVGFVFSFLCLLVLFVFGVRNDYFVISFVSGVFLFFMTVFFFFARRIKDLAEKIYGVRFK